MSGSLAELRAKRFMLRFLEAGLYEDARCEMRRAAKNIMCELEIWLAEEEKTDGV